tara:strand:+ start:3082 stop:3336 length:255 start_codon:yes stop_codon:yes gene_type:complete
MTNKENLKKQIVYRSCHRGTKEMDLLLGNFVKKYLSTFNNEEINDLNKLLLIEDEIIHSWYYKNDSKAIIEKTKVSELLKNFKI